MSKIGLKIEPETYERLKWLKTRFDFVYETNMTWDELFQAIVKVNVYILSRNSSFLCSVLNAGHL